MTKRKLLAIIIALMLCISLCACEQETSETELADSSLGKFVILEEGALNDSGLYQYIMYDPDTMVMYTFLDGYHAGGPIVMYNADGTLKIYSPER